jgi:cellobiose phosphorylase
LLLAEYLRATADVGVLVDEVPYYPVEAGGRGTGLDRIRQAFSFMRDRVGVGAHGLMRLWNSDWNDAFYYWNLDIPYNRMFASAESHLNTAMAVVVLGDLADRLAACAPDGRLAPHRREIDDLVHAFREYRARLLAAFMKDWDDRPFPRRIYVQGERSVGGDAMWLEPQAFTLLIPEVPPDRRAALLGEIDARLMKGEALGARQIEAPQAHPGWEAGSRENGGFWYALNGPLILGVATFDPDRADDLLQQMSFTRFARRFPTFWAGQWSAADTIESSLIESEGLPDQTWTFADVPVYCAHAHAWPLYCYLRLREQGK